MANHYARLPNPLIKIVEEKNLHSQAKFDDIVKFILAQSSNTQFWIRTMLEV